MARYEFKITGLDCSARADQFLAKQKNLPSRSQLKQLFEQERVLVNDKKVRPSAKLREGDTIVVDVPPPTPSELMPEPIELTIIHQDEAVIVIDKPAGLLTHPTPSTTTGTLVNALLHHCKDLSGIGGELKPGIVHRLDKLTSGVMVAAKSDLAHQGLAAQFKAHTIDRRYLALVYGEMEQLTGKIDSPIARNPKQRLKMTGRLETGRRAVTRYRVLGRKHGFSLIECKLETGRTHQIRVHLSENKHPVVGDPLYAKGRTIPGKLDPVRASFLKKIKRQALHAYHLGFSHPVSREWMDFDSPLPKDIKDAAKALELLPDS